MSELTKRRRVVRLAAVKRMVTALGMTWPCRWPQAHERLKGLIIEARRQDDDQLAAQLSEIKALFKAKLLNECDTCGAAISSSANKCKMCRVIR
jgi:hypothetical protein